MLVTSSLLTSLSLHFSFGFGLLILFPRAVPHVCFVTFLGDVTYTVDGFIDKNNDQLFRDLKQAMASSSNSSILRGPPFFLHTLRKTHQTHRFSHVLQTASQ